MELDDDHTPDLEKAIKLADQLGWYAENASSYIAKLESAIDKYKDENCPCIQSFIESQAEGSSDEELHLENASEKKVNKKKNKRRSVCIKRVPSCSSSSDDEEIEFAGSKQSDANSDLGKEGYQSEDDGDESFNTFIHKVKIGNKKNNVVLQSSDEEDGSYSDENSMDDFIVNDESVEEASEKDTWRTPKESEAFLSYSDEDEKDDDLASRRKKDTKFQSPQKGTWRTPKESEAFLSYSDEDEKEEDLAPRIKKDTKFQTPRFKTPFSSRRDAKHTPGILKQVTTPKTPSGTVAYRREFKRLRDQTSKELVDLFNRTVFENKLPDINVIFNKRMTKTAGFCYYYRNKLTEVRTAKIEIAEKVCDSVERLRDTMIHELCHAAAWVLNGVKCGHGTFWKYWATKAHQAHPDLPPISRCHQFDIECRFNYKCINPFCGRSYGRHSKSLKKCPDCQGSLQLLEKDGVTPVRPRQPNKFALYVKENYPSLKADHPDMLNADIMKTLGKKFRMLNTSPR